MTNAAHRGHCLRSLRWPSSSAAAPAHGRRVVHRVDRQGGGRARSAVRLPGDAVDRRNEQQPEGFKPPDFQGLRVLGGPFHADRRSTWSMGGGGTKVENNVTWSYQLALPPGARRDR